MFGALCNFVRKATNGGIIKPSLAVFRPRLYGRHDFRIWNPFIISYAGYQIEEEIPNPTGPGNIRKIKKIGDQGKLEFTRVILFHCRRTEVNLLITPISYKMDSTKTFHINNRHPNSKCFQLPKCAITFLKWAHSRHLFAYFCSFQTTFLQKNMLASAGFELRSWNRRQAH